MSKYKSHHKNSIDIGDKIEKEIAYTLEFVNNNNNNITDKQLQNISEKIKNSINKKNSLLYAYGNIPEKTILKTPKKNLTVKFSDETKISGKRKNKTSKKSTKKCKRKK